MATDTSQVATNRATRGSVVGFAFRVKCAGRTRGCATPASARKAPRMLRVVCVTYLLTLALPVVIAAQDTRPPRPNENVKVLTELEGQPLRAEMQRMSAALGVKCDHCHVQGNFASDEKAPKRTARRMIEMTRALNAQNFPRHQVKDGESVLGRVTCYTCHQGAEEPKSAPPVGK